MGGPLFRGTGPSDPWDLALYACSSKVLRRRESSSWHVTSCR